MSNAKQRLAEIVTEVREINLTDEDKRGKTAVFHLTQIDGRLSINTDGRFNEIANMLCIAAYEHPAIKKLVERVAEVLDADLFEETEE